MKERMDTVVDVLADCQRENGYLSAFPQSFLDRVERLKPVWAPYYTLHKLLSGLLDQHEIGGSAVALRVALQLAHYIQRRVANVVATQGLDHHWQTLNKEFGGLNDVLWKLHGHERDAMTAGGELRLRATASHFDRPCLLGPLAARQDTLTQMHANTQLPVLQGAHSRYEATGDATFRQLASFFVSLLLRTRTFASGGSSIGEYWPAANRLGELVSAGEGTTQESCSTHNMMRLVRGLLMTAPDDGEALEHAEYHERALFNSVLGTQRGESPGEMLYWLPLGAGVSKMDRRHPQHADGQQHGWSIPHGDFWCCVGSGIEAFARLADSTFFQLPRSSPPGAHVAAPTLYVMQPLIASHLEWRAARLNVTMRVDEPGSLPADRPLQVQLRVAPHSSSGGGVSDGIAAGELTIKLRLPRSDAVLPVGTEVSLVPELTNGMLLCAGSADAGAATGGHLMVQREGGDPPQHCSFRLGPPAASYPKLSMWARPAGGGRGFLFYPLKDIVDEAYSVYFHVVVDAASAPRECSVLRDPWRDYDADSPPVPAASRELARKVLGVKAARWSNVKGLEFGAQGVLKTPWSEGSWGVLPDRPGVLFADFGGAQHELTFERWPSFTSMRCSDGEALSGAMLLD